MRVESYTVLHYGKDYITHALRSIQPHVDKAHVVYTPHPSHGSRTSTPPPETRAELLAAAVDAGPHVVWHDVDAFWTEGPHRDYALSLCRGDLALVVDADEVWDGAVLERVLRHVYDQTSRPGQPNARQWLVNFQHYWRSFSWVCRDNMWPVRIHDLRQPARRADGSQSMAYVPKELGEIHHFGYAVRDEIQRYKWTLHGHLAEFRPEWWAKWEAWPPGDDVHPTCLDTWTPEPYDKERLPEVLRGHEFWGMEMIA